jgi:hypothetical protein
MIKEKKKKKQNIDCVKMTINVASSVIHTNLPALHKVLHAPPFKFADYYFPITSGKTIEKREDSGKCNVS